MTASDVHQLDPSFPPETTSRTNRGMKLCTKKTGSPWNSLSPVKVLLMPPHPHGQRQADPQISQVAHHSAGRVNLPGDTVDELTEVGLDVRRSEREDDSSVELDRTPP